MSRKGLNPRRKSINGKFRLCSPFTPSGNGSDSEKIRKSTKINEYFAFAFVWCEWALKPLIIFVN